MNKGFKIWHLQVISFYLRLNESLVLLPFIKDFKTVLIDKK